MESQNTPQIRFNLYKYINQCVKYWYIFVACIVGACLLAGAYLYIRKPNREVGAQLMLPAETSAGGILALSDLATSFSMGDMFGGSSTENEMMVMKSYTVMKKTAEDLQLNISYYEKQGFAKWMPIYEKSQLMITANPAIADTLKVVLQFQLHANSNGTFDMTIKAKKKKIFDKKGLTLPYTVEIPYGEYTIAQTQYYGQGEDPIKNFRIIYSSYGYAAEAYAETVKVFAPNKKADLIGLSYLTPDPKFGKLLLNTIIDNYNAFGNQRNNDKNNLTLGFVNARIESLERELAESETSMENFKKANKLTDVEIDASLLLQKSSVLDASLLQAQTETEILNNTRIFLANPENKYSLIPSLSAGSGEMSSAATAASVEISAYNELILERMKIAASAKTNNASLKQLNSQIDAMRENIITSIDRAYNNSLVKLERIRQENTLTQSRMGTIPTLEKEYIGLERTLILRQQLYLFLLKQREEAQMSLAKTSPSLITVDAPYTLTQIPGLTTAVVLLLAIFLGGILALALIYYTKMNKAPIASVNDVKEACKAPILGDVAWNKDATGLELGDSKTAMSIRLLRSNVMIYEGNVIMAASTVHDEGKSFVAANLAASLAMIGKKTLIIDANMRDPRVAEIFNVSESAGLAQMLASDTLDASGIQKAALPGKASLSVLAAGKAAGNPADLLAKESLKDIIESLRKQYDYIIIDTAPLQQYSDTFSLADYADITLYISRIGLTTPEDLVYANQLYSDTRFKGIAFVVNAVKA